MKWNKNAASQKGRVFRSGLLSTAMLAAVLVLAVLLNLLVRAIPAKYTEFDLSEAKMYTLSDSTKALVEGLEKDVHIYYLCETGSEDTIITKLLDHYAAESGHLSWEQKDPTLYPTFAAKYGAENVSTGSLIVTCGENSTVLDAADLYEYDYTDYYTTVSASVTFGGEKQITSAIYKLTAAGQSHAYYTTNHGEQTLTDSITDALDAQNIDAQPLDLLTSTIPEDCDLLIINAPTSDFTAGDGLVDEISQLQDYLAAGGKLLLTSSVYAQTPQLDAVLAQFGLARAEGMVVEGDSSKALYNSAWSLLPDYGTPTESTALNGVNTSTHVMLSVAQGITVTETEDVTAEPLLNSSSAAYAKTDINDLTTMEREDGDVEGPFALAVWARNEDTGAEVLWIGCPNMDNEQLYQSMPGNLTFLQGCAASLVGQDILVDTKALEAEPITVAGSTAAALGLTFVFVRAGGQRRRRGQYPTFQLCRRGSGADRIHLQRPDLHPAIFRRQLAVGTGPRLSSGRERLQHHAHRPDGAECQAQPDTAGRGGLRAGQPAAHGHGHCGRAEHYPDLRGRKPGHRGSLCAKSRGRCHLHRQRQQSRLLPAG